MNSMCSSCPPPGKTAQAVRPYNHDDSPVEIRSIFYVALGGRKDLVPSFQAINLSQSVCDVF